MNLEITEVKDNALFGRRDIKFVMRHDGETTPSRKQVRELVASEIGAKTNNVIIDHMESATGMAATRGLARAYKDQADAERLERKHMIARNPLGGSKKAEATEEAA